MKTDSIFDVWLLTVFKPHNVPSFYMPQLGKPIREPVLLLLDAVSSNFPSLPQPHLQPQ